jgi:hypothetical protein
VTFAVEVFMKPQTKLPYINADAAVFSRTVITRLAKDLGSNVLLR